MSADVKNIPTPKKSPKTPKLLPWLAKKAGIAEQRAEALWHESERWAERRATADSASYYQMAIDRLINLVAAESLREDAASFGWRPWARAQARLLATSVQILQEGSILTTRHWQALRPFPNHRPNHQPAHFN